MSWDSLLPFGAVGLALAWLCWRLWRSMAAKGSCGCHGGAKGGCSTPR